MSPSGGAPQIDVKAKAIVFVLPTAHASPVGHALGHRPLDAISHTRT
jgi:hypothetical protein